MKNFHLFRLGANDSKMTEYIKYAFFFWKPPLATIMSNKTRNEMIREDKTQPRG